MKILAIGGTGQLGHFVLKHLARAGHVLTAVGIGSAPERGFLPEGTEVMLRDTDSASVAELATLLHGVDVVIHAAGADGRNAFAAPAIDAYRDANVRPVERLVTAMRQSGSRRLVILGSYYTALSRTLPQLALADKSPYIRSRLEQTRAAIAAAGSDVAVGVLELPYVFGAAPGRGTLWGYYADLLRSGAGELPVHAGGTACITMNQVGIAAANLSERIEGHCNHPLGNSNLKYATILGIIARHLGVTRRIVPREPAFFLEAARAQAERMRKSGMESAYDPVGLVEIEDADLYIDPTPSMLALSYGPEDIGAATRQSIDAAASFAADGPGSRK